MSGPIRWQVTPHASFRWRSWDGEYVLYHENSGDTHRLNALGARALELLAAGPVTLAELGGRLAAEFAGAAGREFQAELLQLLARFEDLGLAERLDDPALAPPARSA